MGKKLANWLYGALDAMERKPDQILRNEAVREALQILEPAGNTPKRQKEYVIEKLSLCIMIVVIGVVLSTAMWIKEGTKAQIVDNKIERGAYGDGAKSLTLIAKDSENSYDIPVNIEERAYTQKELTELSEEAFLRLEEVMLGENQTPDRVEHDIRLVKSIEGYPFDVEWRTDGEFVDSEGRLLKARLEEPQLAEVTAVLSCGSFEAAHTMNMQVCTRAVQPSRPELIAEQVAISEEGSRDADFMVLPSEIEDRSIHWRYKTGHTGLIVLLGTPLLALFVYFGRDRDLRGQVKGREEQMRLDYPEIVSALALLIGAGMTVPNAWNKIVQDYKARKQETGEKRFAYEEMQLTVYEIESGVMQAKAYEHFGRRCRIPAYNKLSAMLSQNIRKGASNLPQLLRQEASEAFEERKHDARRLGEKAGTKLLMPMMMLLGMIMIVIMVPAFKGYL